MRALPSASRVRLITAGSAAAPRSQVEQSEYAQKERTQFCNQASHFNAFAIVLLLCSTRYAASCVCCGALAASQVPRYSSRHPAIQRDTMHRPLRLLLPLSCRHYSYLVGCISCTPGSVPCSYPWSDWPEYWSPRVVPPSGAASTSGCCRANWPAMRTRMNGAPCCK